MSAYFYSKWVLGWALLWNLVRRLWQKPMPKRWIDHMLKEGLGPTPAELWQASDKVDACIGCGLCQLHLPANVEASVWLRQIGRQPGQASWQEAQLQLLEKHQKNIEDCCPYQVDVGGFIRRCRAQIKAHR